MAFVGKDKAAKAAAQQIELTAEQLAEIAELSKPPPEPPRPLPQPKTVDIGGLKSFLKDKKKLKPVPRMMAMSFISMVVCLSVTKEYYDNWTINLTQVHRSPKKYDPPYNQPETVTKGFDLR